MKYVLVFLLLGSCNWIPKAYQDNPIEEEVEDYIEEKSGIKIDFTGNSPEKGDCECDSF